MALHPAPKTTAVAARRDGLALRPTQGCERIDDPTPSFPPIPSLPISYGDAEPILAGLEGFKAADDWQGGLALTYRLGPGPVAVRLELEMNTTMERIYDVIGRIDGWEEPNRYVLLGNHRDAWVFGASDPNSGTAALLEIAKGFGQLLDMGWRPRRSIVFGSWDAEEFGLIGSTEWVEENEMTLSQNAVAYLNVDMAICNDLFYADASPTVQHLLHDCAARVEDPTDPSRTLLDNWNSYSGGRVGSPGGDGSDHSGFLHHVGIPIFDAGFCSGPYPVYHSVYDNYRWMSMYGDPGFKKMLAVAKWWGLSVLRLADDLILPLNFTHYTEKLTEHAHDLADLLLDFDAPKAVSITPIWDAIDAFATAASMVEQDRAELLALAEPERSSLAQRKTLNERLMMAERGFLDYDGLPRRPWFRHIIYAPAEHNSYGSSAFPAVHDTITDAVKAESKAEHWHKVQHEIFRVARAIKRAAQILADALSDRGHDHIY